MKNIKTFEESKITTIKSSEMDNWSVDQALNKEKDKSLGEKVIKLLAEYRLYPSITPGNWLKKWDAILESEKIFKEFRIDLGTKQSFEDWLDYEYTGVEYDDLSDEEQLNFENEYDNVEADFDNVEFSVFLPLGVKDVESAMCDASRYLYILSKSLPEVYNSSLDYSGTLNENPDGFKRFLKSKDLTITNSNVEDVPKIEYRLYKDNKFFYHLEDQIGGKHRMLGLIDKWLKLIKNK